MTGCDSVGLNDECVYMGYSVRAYGRWTRTSPGSYHQYDLDEALSIYQEKKNLYEPRSTVSSKLFVSGKQFSMHTKQAGQQSFEHDRAGIFCPP